MLLQALDPKLTLSTRRETVVVRFQQSAIHETRHVISILWRVLRRPMVRGPEERGGEGGSGESESRAASALGARGHRRDPQSGAEAAGDRINSKR